MTGAHREPPGSVAEEAARLLAALQERVGPVRADGTAADGRTAAGAECRYCPVCQALAAVRSTNPEVTEHLVAAASELVDAWRAARAPRAPREDGAADGSRTAPPEDDGSDPPAGPGGGDPPAGRQGRGVQHIDVR